MFVTSTEENSIQIYHFWVDTELTGNEYHAVLGLRVVDNCILKKEKIKVMAERSTWSMIKFTMDMSE